MITPKPKVDASTSSPTKPTSFREIYLNQRDASRIAELDAQIQAYSGDIDQMERVRLAAERLRELSVTIGPDLADADWHRRRDVIRTLVQRVEIGHENMKIVFRVLQDAARSGPESIAVMLPR